jgi:hypothetical protein
MRDTRRKSGFLAVLSDVRQGLSILVKDKSAYLKIKNMRTSRDPAAHQTGRDWKVPPTRRQECRRYRKAAKNRLMPLNAAYFFAAGCGAMLRAPGLSAETADRAVQEQSMRRSTETPLREAVKVSLSQAKIFGDCGWQIQTHPQPLPEGGENEF